MGVTTGRRRVERAAGPAPSDDPTGEQDLHAVDTVLLAVGRARWDERPTADDKTRIDQVAFEGETALHVREISGEITAETPRAVESTPPLSDLASNPEPTVATKLDPGITHLVPGTLVGEFVIDRLLGAGAMGEVYGGRHEQLGKRVAIKVIAPSLSRDRSAIERFEQEAIALARLSHPNIVGVLGVGTLPGDGRSYYAMEWIDGESLQARIDRDALPVAIALEVLDQVARGLDAAHAAGIVHRDLKPDNLFLQRVGDEPVPVVRIVDFGLAKLTAHRRSEDTAVGLMFGTPQYMSPEQCQSARDVGPATDVYALGVIAYELLCGRIPFAYDNGAELIAAHQTEQPPHPRDLSPAIDARLDELLFAMLAKDPTERPTLAVVRATIAAVRAKSASPPPPHARSSTVPGSRRGLLVAISGLVLAVLVLAVLVANSLMRDREDRTGAQVVGPPPDATTLRTVPQQPPPADMVEPTVDAGATPQAPDARTNDETRVREARVRVDAGHEGLTVDADQPDAASTQPQEPTPIVEPRITDRVPTPPSVTRESPQARDRNPPPPTRDPRDRTYDPFHRSPR